jgi:release factor glutamine methyltransferase
VTTVAAALAAARTELRSKGVDSAPIDARLLLAWSTGQDQPWLLAHPEQPVSLDAAIRFREAVARRSAGEPVARILGVKEFWGLTFRLSPATLEPRPDTETLVEAAVQEARRLCPAGNLNICDLGTGTGAIMVAILKELPQARGTAVDLAASAVEMARRNAQTIGVAARISFLVGDYSEVPDEPFDMVVSNPPYIESAALSGLAVEVRDHDPRLALDGGPDGLEAYRTILRRAARIVRPGGALLFEVGLGQADPVARIAEASGLSLALVRADLAGTPRVLVLRRSF